MNLLALDTATEYLSLALSLNGELHARDWLVKQGHAELTLPYLQTMLAEVGTSLQQIDGIALSIGPGGFTGLRIGCGIAQGLALGLDIPAVGVDSLHAMAADEPADAILVAQDARMGELYLAAFQRQDGVLQQVLESGVYKPQDLPELPGTWLGIGSGFAVQGDALAQRYALQAVHADRFPHARGVLRIAEAEFAAGRAAPADQLELRYIRNKVALTSAEQAKAKRA